MYGSASVLPYDPFGYYSDLVDDMDIYDYDQSPGPTQRGITQRPPT